MHPMVVRGAEKNSVVQVCGPTVAHPPAQVVGFGMGGWARAVPPRASAVPLGEGETLRATEQSASAPEVENLGRAAQHHRDDLGLGGEPARDRRRDRLVDAVDAGSPELAPELVERHAHDDGGGGERRRTVVAAEAVPREVDDRVGADLDEGAAVDPVFVVGVGARTVAG